jgi:hypothetical protein
MGNFTGKLKLRRQGAWKIARDLKGSTT